MRYCVTGACGVMASRFVASLDTPFVVVCDDGKEPRHRFNGRSIEHKTESFHWHQLGGVDESISLDGFDRCLHAAASTGIPYSSTAPLDDWNRNVDGTLEVLEAVKVAKKPPTTVILSSVKPYGLSELSSMERDDHFALSGRAVDERALLSPEEPYAASKAAQSMISQAYARSYDLPIAIFRCSNLFGPAAPHGPRHGWCTWLCIQAALGATIEIQGSGKQTRDMLFSSDLNSAIMLAFQALEAGDIERGTIYNIGGGPDRLVSVLQLVEMLRSMGASFDVRSAPGRKHEDMLFCADSSKAEREVGWERKVSVRDGVAQVYEWAYKNRDELREVYKEQL